MPKHRSTPYLSNNYIDNSEMTIHQQHELESRQQTVRRGESCLVCREMCVWIGFVCAVMLTVSW